MRISTSQIYEAGTLNLQRNQSALYKLQNQLSTGRRVLTPADDPIAAAQSLLFAQRLEMNDQQITNQGTAESQLGVLDSQLTAVVNLIMNVRDRVIQAGNTSLNDADRESIADELESRFSELLGIANAQNGTGSYLFSGYQGGTVPFAIDASQTVIDTSVSPDALSTITPVSYYGDDGERLLQVSSSRVMPVNVAGSDVFMNVKQGNGTFVVETGGNLISGGINQGSAKADGGSVIDQQQWQSALDSFAWGDSSNPSIEVEFSILSDVTYYRLWDVSGSPVALTGNIAYTEGQAIPIVSDAGDDFGVQFTVKGAPADGDTFAITPSTDQSLFLTMQKLIGALRTPVGTASYTTTEYVSEIGEQLANLDRSMDNIVRVQATVGARMLELESLGEAASDLDLQYETTLSDLQDLDYADAISKFAMQQTYLEAAQASFAKISGLSLFDYL